MNLMTQAAKLLNGVETIQEWLGAGAVTVSPELAQQRATICIGCPKNIKGGLISASIAEAIRKQVELKNKLNLRVAGEKELGRCAACLCESRLKIWLPLRNILPEPSERANFEQNYCWLLKEAEKENL
jgi:hypothetical protein